MLVDQRRQQIIQTIENKGFVSIAELTETIGAANRLCDAIWSFLTELDRFAAPAEARLTSENR